MPNQPETGLDDASERVISRLPVTIRRRVRWGDCDPAGVVYTPAFAHYAVSAFEWTMEALLGGPLHRESEQLAFGTPFKALTFEFRSALRPDQLFDMECTIPEIRNRTFDIDILARDIGHKHVFVARLTPIFVALTERRAIPIPAEVRAKLEDYRRHCRSVGPAVSSVLDFR
jgi:acyl-CoA thioesterase FadM